MVRFLATSSVCWEYFTFPSDLKLLENLIYMKRALRLMWVHFGIIEFYEKSISFIYISFGCDTLNFNGKFIDKIHTFDGMNLDISIPFTIYNSNNYMKHQISFAKAKIVALLFRGDDNRTNRIWQYKMFIVAGFILAFPFSHRIKKFQV